MIIEILIAEHFDLGSKLIVAWKGVMLINKYIYRDDKEFCGQWLRLAAMVIFKYKIVVVYNVYFRRRITMIKGHVASKN